MNTAMIAFLSFYVNNDRAYRHLLATCNPNGRSGWEVMVGYVREMRRPVDHIPVAKTLRVEMRHFDGRDLTTAEALAVADRCLPRPLKSNV